MNFTVAKVAIIHLLQKPTDLDLHCLQRQGISVFSRTKVNSTLYEFHISHKSVDKVAIIHLKPYSEVEDHVSFSVDFLYYTSDITLSHYSVSFLLEIICTLCLI